jgi:hypothetical protein
LVGRTPPQNTSFSPLGGGFSPPKSRKFFRGGGRPPPPPHPHRISPVKVILTRLELGRAFYQRALMRRRPDQNEAIEQDLKRARELFAACGALRDLERTEAMLQ